MNGVFTQSAVRDDKPISLLPLRAAERGIFLVVKDAAEEQSCIPRARTVFACFMPSKRSSLLAKKPANLLLKEVGSGHGLRPVLGPLQLTSLGVGAIVGAGIFVIIGVVAKDKAGAATDAFLCRRRLRLRLCRALLC